MFEVYEHREQSVTLSIQTGLNDLPMLFHKHMEFLYVLDGEFTTRIDGIEKTIRKGEAAVTFPYILHRSKESKATFLLLLFDPQLCGDFYGEITQSKPEDPFLPPNDRSRAVFRLLDLMRDKAENDPDCRPELLAAYINALVGETLRAFSLKKTDGTSLTTAQKILFYCSHHYRQTISLDTLSAALFLSKNHITRTFRQKIGSSFCDYIHSLRIHLAADLLLHTERSVTDILYECGYNNQSTFNRAFFTLCGTTPGEYRRKAR